MRRPYVEQAVDNVLDAHASIEAELGTLRPLIKDPVIGNPGRELTAWAPLYDTEDGIREIRRVRLGNAHDNPDEDELRWAAAAAQVAATYSRGATPQRVRVVEIGPADGSIAVLFDGTVDAAKAFYAFHSRERASAIVVEDHVVPGLSCGDCKVAGACSELLQLDGMLGQERAGMVAASVAPPALVPHRRCHGQ